MKAVRPTRFGDEAQPAGVRVRCRAAFATGQCQSREAGPGGQQAPALY